MEIDHTKLKALKDAIEIVTNQKIPDGVQHVVQHVRDLAAENLKLKRRAKLEKQLARTAARAARAAVDAGFRRRDKKAGGNSANRRVGQYDDKNWDDAFAEVRRLMQDPDARIGEVLASVQKEKHMYKVSPGRFRRKWYQELERKRRVRAGK